MKASEFAALLPEQVAELTGKDKAAYEKWLAKQVESEDEEEEEVPTTVAERAAEFFAGNKGYAHDSIDIVADGSMFAPTLKGSNDRDNHIKSLPKDLQKYTNVKK